MSLELKIEALTVAVQALTTVMQTGQQVAVQFGADTATGKPATTRRGKKDDEQKTDYPLLPGDAEGTRYWVIEKHSTVYVQKPGDPEPGIEGAKIESSAHYLAKKEEFAKKALTSAGSGTQTGAAASNTTSTASSSTPDASQASGEVTFKQVVEALTALNSSTKPGHGREAVKAFLLKHVGEGKNVPALEALKKNAELLAEVTALLAPAAATDDNLFG